MGTAGAGLEGETKGGAGERRARALVGLVESLDLAGLAVVPRAVRLDLVAMLRDGREGVLGGRAVDVLLGRRR